MKAEYEKIKQDSIAKGVANGSLIGAIGQAVEACEALAARPVKELTDEECYNLWLSVWSGKFDTILCSSGTEIVRKIIAAYVAKQSAPETVGVTLYRSARGAVVPAISPHDLPIGDWTPISDRVEIQVKP